MNLLQRQQPISRSRPHAAGFTLIELLVGFVIFALISIALAGGLRFGVRAWEAGRNRAEPTNEVDLAQTLLRRELSQAALPLDDGDRAFVGSADELAFSAPLPAAAGELYAFALSATQGQGRSDLALRWRPVAAGAAAEAAESTVVLENIAGLELAYFGNAGPGQPPAWSGHWSGRLGLPELIRLRVAFPAGDPRLWPDLFVAPRYEFVP